MKQLLIALLMFCSIASMAQTDTIATQYWAQGAWTYKRSAADTMGVVLYMQHFNVQQTVDSEPYPDVYGASTFYTTNDFVHPNKWNTPIQFFMQGYSGDKEIVFLACNNFGGTATITIKYLSDGRVMVKTTDIKNGMTPLPSGVYVQNNNLPITNYKLPTCEVNPYE